MIYASLQSTTSGMKFSLRQYVCLVGLLLGVKNPNVKSFFPNSYARFPFVFVSGNSKHSRCFVSLCWANMISSIFKPTDITKVGDSVVIFHSINVINLMFWPCFKNIEPGKPVRFVTPFINADIDIPISIKSAGNHSCHGVGAGRNSAGKNASILIVVKKFAQTLCGKIGLSHDAVLSLIGQRPGSVSALSGPRYFRQKKCNCT